MSAQVTVAQGDPVSTAAVTVDPTNSASRTSLRPLDHSPAGQVQGGHYRASVLLTPNASLSAAGVWFSLRWTPTNMLFVLKRIRGVFVILTTITTGTPNDLAFFKYTGATATGSGGTTFAPASGQKSRTSNMANSLNTAMRFIASTVLTADTGKTNDGKPFAQAGFTLPSLTVAGTTSAPLEFYKEDATGQHPIVLGANEGIEGQVVTANATSGTTQIYLDIEWAEVAVY